MCGHPPADSPVISWDYEQEPKSSGPDLAIRPVLRWRLGGGSRSAPAIKLWPIRPVPGISKLICAVSARSAASARTRAWVSAPASPRQARRRTISTSPTPPGRPCLWKASKARNCTRVKPISSIVQMLRGLLTHLTHPQTFPLTPRLILGPLRLPRRMSDGLTNIGA